MKLSGILAGGLVAGWCAVAGLAATPGPAPKPAPAAASKPGAPKPPANGEAARPAVANGGAAKDPGVPAEAAEFFEAQVRPVLADHCYACHGGKIQQAGLRLDSRAAMLKGSDSGRPALVPGDAEKSLLIQAVHFNGPVKMPPQGKLPDAMIEALTKWVKMGAPWPNAGAPLAVQAPAKADPAKHWSFQPVANPPAPAVKNKAWVKTPVDAFVLAKLERKGIAPSKPADRRTLIRRAYFDLIGLPPTAEETDAFLADGSPDAFAKVVDHLLASPRYGERWARYWLDVARYADTKGYVFQEERRYPYAYTYRDYVVRAFNEDLPYDQFLIQQVAADQLPLGADKRPLAAMGFLTLGRRFLNNTPDIIDDRLDTVFRGTQALTVACARCHDHKFDPIPTKDYYSLYGVFASSTEPQDLPLISEPQQTDAYLAYEKQLNALQGAAEQFRAAKHGEILALARARIGDALMAAREGARPGADVTAVAQKRDLPTALVRRWMAFLADTAGKHHPVMEPWNLFAAIPDAEFGAKAPAVAAQLAANADAQNRLNPNVVKLFAGKAPASLAEVAASYGQLLANPPPGDDQLAHALDSIGGPLNIEVGQVEQFFNRADANKLRELRIKVDSLKATSPAAPPRAMALVDAPTPVTPRVFKRGNQNNPGEEVPRQFLAVLTGPQRKPFQKGSGRLEMAQAIASKNNPLTARVMVNRIWMYHLGSPLVRTPSDFGLRSEPPTNPELLDFLATRFMEDGWSLKKMHRLIMLSSVYQQSSDDNPAARKTDPENALYWRMNRRRLEFEAMRDSLLFASGKLDLTVGGPSVELTTQPFTTRRAVYGFVDRQNLPNLFRTFDFASPDTTSPQRFSTTVPQQALFLMNSPFVVDQARQLALRAGVTASKPAAEKIRQLYRLAYGRDAAPDEVTMALRFLKAAEGLGAEGAPRDSDVWQYGYGEVDESAGRLRGFQPLAHFTGSAWQGGPVLPDPKTGWATLNAVGGHPGNDSRHAAVRRWVAPRDGAFSIGGTLTHRSEQGDGVRARILSSRGGNLGTWVAQKSMQETVVHRFEARKGDTVDFVVDCRNSPDFDAFEWAPTIVPVAQGADSTENSGGWSARTGFSGPQNASAKTLSPWEKYAQVLLLSNEFMFVD
jgi:hypothetical protein